MKNYVLDRGIWAPASARESIEFIEDKAAKFERMQQVAAQLVADYALKGPAGLMAMAASGQQAQIDKLIVGYSPRFTAIQAATLVRAGVGILVAVTLGIAAAAGSTVALFDGNGGAGASQISPTIDATKGPITLWIYQAFGQTINVTTQGLFLTIAAAVTDCNIVTAGI